MSQPQVFKGKPSVREKMVKQTVRIPARQKEAIDSYTAAMGFPYVQCFRHILELGLAEARREVLRLKADDSGPTHHTTSS